jgi:hypothetical protein
MEVIMKETVARLPRGTGLGPRARIGELGLALLGLFLVSLAVAPPASATTLASWALEDFVYNANAAVVGRVSAIDVRWNDDHTFIQTYVTLDITQPIAGETLPTQIVLEEMGGRVGRQINRVEGVPAYQIGEEVFVFVEKIDGRYRTLGFYQGKYTLETDTMTGEQMYVQRVPAGAVNIVGPEGLVSPAAQSYGREELIARVREIAGK